MNRYTINSTLYLLITILFLSCIKKTDFSKKKEEEQEEKEEVAYTYPFKDEACDIIIELVFKTNGQIDLKTVQAEIPPLKYNKSWLFLLTQDDCSQTAYCNTWAAIHGKPLSSKYYYDAAHLKAGDLPPDNYNLGKTLGCTDGSGNEVRFSFTTTLAPEWEWMNAKPSVQVGFTKNYYRFYMKSGLIWNNVIEMVNYGVGIAFHDVKTSMIHNRDSIKVHYTLSQRIITDKLSGRVCKVLTEPNGNKTYVEAALAYDPIQIMAAQSEASTLYPFKTTNDLHKQLLNRYFYTPEQAKENIRSELQKSKEERAAVQIGVHKTDPAWAQFLLWLNNTYGKDGDDSVWSPSLEEYYEYNYNRIHSIIRKQIIGNTLKLTVVLPSKAHFYYPSITVKLDHLQKQHITSIISGNTVSGLSYADDNNGLMLNIDCRKFLLHHATHYVRKYESDKTVSNRNDALYFVNQLKDSDKKSELLKRIK
ncbi:hypothetical protein [Gabonibacter chumensis]|uniref:hypothetical protein n=1 Tax=Gabonibacter chumensis TaxID=2972474 RepID=UPI0025733DFF|nr:hypothetical protein [Gabonibacter chumensis]MCR9011828.1 hypothetical protein [Gabonibacter chumensis]